VSLTTISTQLIHDTDKVLVAFSYSNGLLLQKLSKELAFHLIL